MKKLIFAFFFLLLFSVQVSAAHQEEENQNIYNQQLEDSGAQQIADKLPNETVADLEKMGVKGANWKNLINLNAKKVLEQIWHMTKKQSVGPLGAAFSVLAVILLSALMQGTKSAFAKNSYKNSLSAVSTICICVAIISPIVGVISRASKVTRGAATFMLGYVPVLAGIMVSAGRAVSASSYNILMMSLSQVISQVSSRVLVPFLNMFLAISLISSISSGINLSGICTVLKKTTKWALTFFMTIFTAMLTFQSFLGGAADGVGAKTAKFMVSSCVPVVGNVISEALTTVQSYVKLLKSGVGAFGIIAFAFIFLPIILECLTWMLTIHLCTAVSTIFNLDNISCLLQNTGKVIEILLSIVICCMTVLIISTVIILTIGSEN